MLARNTLVFTRNLATKSGERILVGYLSWWGNNPENFHLIMKGGFHDYKWKGVQKVNN